MEPADARLHGARPCSRPPLPACLPGPAPGAALPHQASCPSVSGDGLSASGIARKALAMALKNADTQERYTGLRARLAAPAASG
jgi:hypothetical protein